MRLLVVGLVFCIFLVGTVSAAGFTPSSVSINPPGAMVAGSPVTASFTVNLTEPFPAGNDLVLSTELANSRWSYVILVNGVENLRPVMPVQTLDIKGFELTYKPADNVSVRGVLTGTAPAVPYPQEKTILRIAELDDPGIIMASPVVYTAMITTAQINPIPEFPSVILPAALIIGLLGTVLFIRKTRED